MEESISGSIEHIIYTNEENGFTVAHLKENTKKICIVGKLPNISLGEYVTCQGTWKDHKEYGEQFVVNSFSSSYPVEEVGIELFLASGFIKGIGKTHAKTIVEAFGKETLDILEESPHRLLSLKGIGKKRIEEIKKSFKEKKHIKDVMLFLRGHKVSEGLAHKIYKQYGDETITILKQNPYAVIGDLTGVGFLTADQLASNLGIERDDPKRCDAAIVYHLDKLSEEGHCCYIEDEFLDKVSKALAIDRTLCHRSITRLEESGKIKREVMPSLDSEVPFIWLAKLFYAELGITKEIERIAAADCNIRSVKVDKALDWVESLHKLKLAKEQKKAVAAALEDKIHIITGGPGTGKSTITKTILSIHEKLSDKILLAAPTGRAAKRLSEITRKHAKTIHSLLEVDFTTRGFKRGHGNPLECDLLIIDEASMIDTYLMFSLLKAVPDGARIVLIGDIDQLPSVGPGTVLKDMIESKNLPITRLYQIFRQAKESLITINAHAVNRGAMPNLETSVDDDFWYIERDEPAQMIEEILNLIEHTLPKKFNFHKTEDIQVLSPMKRGKVGIENLNQVLQAKLNTSDVSLQRGETIYKIGDKVIQLKNNYQNMVFNGDIGYIIDIDKSSKEVVIKFDYKEIEYSYDDLGEITLAYAVSIHKYQGSESPCIILPLHTSHFVLLQRNLIYTAITRAKKLLVLVSSKKAIALGIHNNLTKKRLSGLTHFLTQALGV
ncbi:MAG: ATP-dependent RecD-like DNA helicase [Chlamydiia bacterium]|nr:ATP-dependent RecD-like DNA helicase [Chlamydiia bacterium]